MFYGVGRVTWSTINIKTDEGSTFTNYIVI